MRICACAILVKDNRFLLGRRAPHRKAYAEKWDVIGGRVEHGETLEEALGRELREELGVMPVMWESVGSLLDTSPDAQGPASYHFFAVNTWTGGPPEISNHEHTELAWFTVAEACALIDLALDDYRSVFRMLRF